MSIRQVCVLEDGKFVWKDKDEHYSTSSAAPKVHVIGDEMPPAEHPCDGRVYNSKSAFREVTRAYGCYEVGNDKLPSRPTEEQVRKENRASLARAIQEAIAQCQSGKS